MHKEKGQHSARIYLGLFLLIFGFLSPLFSFLIKDQEMNEALKAFIIGGLVFGIPELMIVMAIAVMGKEAWEFIRSKLHGILSHISPQKVSKIRYYTGVGLFFLCLIEGAIEIHSTIIQDYLNDDLISFHWIMNGLFLMSFFIAGGDFWDKIRKLFIYNSTEET